MNDEEIRCFCFSLRCIAAVLHCIVRFVQRIFKHDDIQNFSRIPDTYELFNAHH